MAAVVGKAAGGGFTRTQAIAKRTKNANRPTGNGVGVTTPTTSRRGVVGLALRTPEPAATSGKCPVC